MRRLNLAVSLFILLLTIVPAVNAKMRNVNKKIAGTPPFVIAKDIVTANSKMVASGMPRAKRFAPYITWLTDPDPRLQPRLILSQPFNNVYSCRNLGAQVAVAAGELDYGIRHLHTPILLITVNTDNEAVRLFLEGYDEMGPEIGRVLDHLNPALAGRALRKKSKDKKGALLRAVEADVDYQVETAYKRYIDRIKLGRLDIIGGIIDLKDIYKSGSGRLIIININGEKDPAKLQRLQVSRTLPLDTLQKYLGRKKAAPPKASSSKESGTPSPRN